MSFLREVPLDEHEFPPFANARKAFGFVPNFYRAQTLRPDLIEAETSCCRQAPCHARRRSTSFSSARPRT